jgi:hypothetical protein
VRRSARTAQLAVAPAHAIRAATDTPADCQSAPGTASFNNAGLNPTEHDADPE